MYLLLFFSPDWLTFGHMTISHINSLVFFIHFLFLSDEGPMLETLDYTIRIGSTPTLLYFDLYLYSAYAAHFVYIICVYIFGTRGLKTVEYFVTDWYRYKSNQGIGVGNLS